VDRDIIRRNEFEWLLRSDVANLASDGLLPPRFQDLASSLLPKDPHLEETLRSTGSVRTKPGTANEARSTYEGFDSEDAKKHSVLRQWLESQLVECVAPQAACVAAGLREVIPYGALALLQPHELQAFLAGKL